jgi:hypothetical protein
LLLLLQQRIKVEGRETVRVEGKEGEEGEEGGEKVGVGVGVGDMGE